jgi:hypothetical protein
MYAGGVMHRSFPALAAAVVALSVSACGIHGPFNAEARDTWSRTYPLSKTGEVVITNTNGRVEVEGTDGSTVDVQAERIAHAATDQLAHDLLPKITISESSTPDRVHVETGRIAGILIGASFEVQYHVKVPKGATVRALTVNGGVRVMGLSGRVVARTTNGGVTATDISGSLEGRTVNGGVRASFKSLGTNDVTLSVVNGGIRVRLPENAKAAVNATWVNGGFQSSGLQFEVRDKGKRHFEGVLNGGGPSITATTVNGGVTIDSSSGSASASNTDEDDEPALKSLQKPDKP